MHDLHIVDFFRDSALILVQLYNRFPAKSTLYMDDICGPDSPDEFGLHSPRFSACFNAALWLADEGYFRFSQPLRQEALEDAVLTQQAFLQLSSLSSMESPESRVTTLKTILKENNSNKLNTYLLKEFEDFQDRKS